MEKGRLILIDISLLVLIKCSLEIWWKSRWRRWKIRWRSINIQIRIFFRNKVGGFNIDKILVKFNMLKRIINIKLKCSQVSWMILLIHPIASLFNLINTVKAKKLNIVLLIFGSKRKEHKIGWLHKWESCKNQLI